MEEKSKTKTKESYSSKLQKWYDKSCWDFKKEIDQISRCVSRYSSFPVLTGKLHNEKKLYKKLTMKKKGGFQK